MEFVNSTFKGQQNGVSSNSKSKSVNSKSRPAATNGGGYKTGQNGSVAIHNSKQNGYRKLDQNQKGKVQYSKQQYHQIVNSAMEQGANVKRGQNLIMSNGHATVNMDGSNLGALFNGLALKNQETTTQFQKKTQIKTSSTKSYSAIVVNSTQSVTKTATTQPSQEELTLKLNTEALQRLDPAFTRLHGSASQVAVYDFDAVTSYWTDTKTVGCLFLYSRSVAPEYGLVVLNRKGLQNLVITFDKQSQIIPHEPYLLFRRGSNQVIKCIWFYKNSEFHTVTEVFRKIGVQFDNEDTSENGETQDSPVKPQEIGPNLFDMLQQSQTKIDDSINASKQGHVLTAQELENRMLKDSKVSPRKPPQFNSSKKENVNPHSTRLQSLEVDEPGSALLKKFSAILPGNANGKTMIGTFPEKAVTIKNGTGISRGSPPSNDASRSRSMRTVEQLEKDLMPLLSSKDQDSSKKDISNELLATLGISIAKDSAAESNSETFSPKSPFMTPMSASSRSDSDRSTRKMTIDDLDGKLYEETDENMVREVVDNLSDLTELLLLSENVPGHSEPQLVWRKRSNLQNRPSSALIQVPQMNNVCSTPQSQPPVIGYSNNICPLTQNQLSQAIVYLLQTDPSFTTKIHEAYLKSLQPTYQNRLG